MSTQENYWDAIISMFALEWFLTAVLCDCLKKDFENMPYLQCALVSSLQILSAVRSVLQPLNNCFNILQD